MVRLLNLSTFYFSNLVDRYKLSAILWCALRCEEGRQDISIVELAAHFGVKVQTIRKHLNNKMFFRCFVRLSKNVYRVYLTGIKQLKQQDLRLGVKWESTLVRVTDLVQEARHVATLGLQKRLRRSRIFKNRQQKKQVKTLNSVAMFTSDGTPITNATWVLHSSKKTQPTLFVCSSVDISGATQPVIAKELNRHPNTIRTALRNVQKVRVFKFAPEYYMHYKEHVFLDAEQGTSNRYSYYKYGNYTFKACPTQYYPCIDLCGFYS